MQQPTSNVLDRFEAVMIDIRLWSAMKKLTEADLNLPPNTLPPKELASLSSIRIIDPEKLDIFETLKRRATRLCEKFGVRFLGGYAIPKDRIAELLPELQKICSEGEEERAKLVDTYTRSIDEFCEKWPNYSHLIREKAPTPGAVEKKIQFDYQIFAVGKPDSADAAKSLNKVVHGLADQLADEIAKVSNDIFETSFKGKVEVKQTAINSLQPVLKKMQSLSFLNPAVASVALKLETVLGSLPKTGKIEGAHYDSVLSVLLLMSDANRMREHADGLSDALDAISAPVIPAATTPQMTLTGLLATPPTTTAVSVSTAKVEEPEEFY